MKAVFPINVDTDFNAVLNQPYNNYRQTLPLVTYKNCFITHSGIGMKNFQILPETSFDNLTRNVKKHFYKYALFKYFTEHKIYPDQSNLLLLHNHWSNGYHHWLTECLIKIQFINPSAYTLIIPEDSPTFVFDSLRLFPFKDILKVPSRTGIKVKSITVLGNPYSGAYNPDHLAALKLYLIESCKRITQLHPPKFERIYVSRQEEHLRKVENETEVIALLKQYDFNIVDPKKLSFQEQVLLFAQCRFFVSIHGAALTNCMFMPKNANILELYRVLTPVHNHMNTCYWYLSAASGLNYYYQFCEHGINRGDNLDKINIVVSIEKLRTTIESMLVNN